MGEESVGKETKPPIQPPAREDISRFTKFRQWLRNFGRPTNISVLSPPQTVVQETVVEAQEMPQIQQPTAEQVEEPAEGIVPQHITGIASILAEKIEERGGITPPEFEKRGEEAILGTNETMSDGFFETIQQKNPDGYIVAVGVGNSFALPYCFPEESEPKGMILADIDPKVVAVGKLVVQTLAAANTLDDFVNSLFRLSREQFRERMHEIIAKETDPILRNRLENIVPEEYDKIHELIPKLPYPYYRIRNTQPLTYKEGSPILVDHALFNKFATLQKLAREGNIAVVYADFTNPAFIETVMDLPEFRDSTNVIYLSNIVDHITKRGFAFENATVLDNLRRYETSSKRPIFIDTVSSLDYFLRARHKAPIYRRRDIRMNPFPNQEKPAGLLFADEEELERVNLSALSNEELQQRYQIIAASRVYQERKRQYEQRHNYSYEGYYIPGLARSLYIDRKSEQENPQGAARLFPEGYREFNAVIQGEEAVQMAELYEEMINRVWQAKRINMWDKTLSEVLSEL